MKNRIGVIVIIYNTSEINTIIDDNLLIVVDNTPNQDLGLDNNENFIYLPLGENLGIAEAQNQGIKIAIDQGCSHIIFFDQDSIVSKDFIKNMVDEYERINKTNPNLFLLGPTVINGRHRFEYKSTLHREITTEYNFTPRREIISSGSCIATDKIKSIGLLDSSLFIDYVDFEWCWRANKNGFINGITPNVTLTHFVGQNEYRIFNQLVIISSPIRYYYQTRNYLWLIRRRYVPLQWKINAGIKKLFFPLTFPFKTKNWLKIYQFTFSGFIAGLRSSKS